MNTKSLKQIFEEKGIKGSAGIRTFLRENRIAVLKKANGHSYGNAGEEVLYTDRATLYSSGGKTMGMSSMTVKSNGSLGNTIYFSELKLLYPGGLSKEGLSDELKYINKQQSELTEKKKDVTNKLAFLKEIGVDKFSENEYKSYMVLKTLEQGDLSQLDKAKAIAKLIDG